tara:strand:- start:23 stop:619 length:597 start_codon:yes stop_codon:yes gene_type:complete
VIYTYKLTEEISRWAFEIHIKNINSWWIAYTNPTAGPWKRVESYDEKNEKGEVCRFGRDEKRPDIVIVNDELKIIIIFEAKDSLDKLKSKNQIEKSCKVVEDMAKTLNSIVDNPYWGERHSYKKYNGLLWGSTNLSSNESIQEVFRIYSEELNRIESIIDKTIQIGVESNKDINNSINISYHTNSESKIANNIIESLK